MPRGYHNRNWVTCWDLDHSGYDRYEIEHEEAATAKGGRGLFGVIHCEWRDRYYVIWRPNRNTTRDTKVMRDGDGRDHVWNREEVAYQSMHEAIESIAAWNTCFDYPKRDKRRPRDSQKSKVYRWEHRMAKEIGVTEEVESGRYADGSVSYVQRNKLERLRSEDFLRNALEHICINMNEHPVELKFRTGGRSSYGGTRIRLLPCHKNLLVLLHELAHVLTRRWYGLGMQSHGPEFVGVYAYLLIRFGEVKRDEIVRHAAEAGVKMVLPDRYWTWADEPVPVEFEEDFTGRLQEAARSS